MNIHNVAYNYQYESNGHGYIQLNVACVKGSFRESARIKKKQSVNNQSIAL